MSAAAGAPGAPPPPPPGGDRFRSGCGNPTAKVLDDSSSDDETSAPKDIKDKEVRRQVRKNLRAAKKFRRITEARLTKLEETTDEHTGVSDDSSSDDETSAHKVIKDKQLRRQVRKHLKATKKFRRITEARLTMLEETTDEHTGEIFEAQRRLIDVEAANKQARDNFSAVGVWFLLGLFIVLLRLRFESTDA